MLRDEWKLRVTLQVRELFVSVNEGLGIAGDR